MITIKQVEQIEKYVSEIQYLKNSNLHGKNYWQAAINIDKKIEASSVSYKSSINWNNAISPNMYGQFSYCDKQISMNLDIICAALQGILNAQPYYDRLLEIRQTICDIENADSRCKRDKVEQAIEEYNKIIEWEYENPIDDVELIAYEIICKLNRYIRRLPDEFDKKKLENIPSSAINVVQTNSQVSNQTVFFSIEQCLQELDDCEKIDGAELEYIKTQLNELQQLLESKKRGNKVREKVSAILKWLADKTTDVMIAVLPALITGLKG